MIGYPITCNTHFFMLNEKRYMIKTYKFKSNYENSSDYLFNGSVHSEVLKPW